MTDGFSPLKGKCTWWRERAVEDDIWDTRLKPAQKRIDCFCFVEGKGWKYPTADVPADCPDERHCRYYIRHW
jgi:hypothetical protein